MVRGIVALAVLPGLAPASVEIPTKLIAHDVYMPVMSIGTGGKERKEAKEIVSSWLSLGGRGIDTAQAYGNAGAVAEAISESGVSRQDLFITTKITGCDGAEKNIEDQLKDLGTSYLDLMLIHVPRGDCATAWATLEKYHADGVLKAIGVSNFERTDIDSLKLTMKVIPHVNQVELNVLSHDDDTINASTEIGIHMEAYSPLGRGGKDISGNPTVQAVAGAHNVSTYQVALKWILQKGHVLTFQSSNPAHQESNADVFGFKLSDAETAQLDTLQAEGAVVV